MILGDIKHDVGLPETKIVFQLVTDVDEKSEVRRCIEEKTPESEWSVPNQVLSNLLFLPRIKYTKPNLWIFLSCLLQEHAYQTILRAQNTNNNGKVRRVKMTPRMQMIDKMTKEFKTGKINVIELIDAVGVGAFDVYLMQTLGKKRKRDNGSQQNQE